MTTDMTTPGEPDTPAEMRAAIYRRPGDLEVVSIPTPEPKPDETLVRVEYCGICGTDLHTVLDGWGQPGSIGGHEWSGRVVRSGSPALAADALVVGQQEPACGRCRSCGAGRPSLCENRPLAGTGGPPGAFAEYLAIKTDHLIQTPVALDAATAAFTEPLAVAMHAVSVANAAPTDRVLVSGGGPVGAAITAFLLHEGVRLVTVSEPSRARRDLAAALGADPIEPSELVRPDHPGEVVDQPFTLAFEASGIREAIETSLTQLGGAGRLVLVGTGLDLPRLDTSRVLLNELVITGAFNYDPHGFERALDLLAVDALPVDRLVEGDPVSLEQLLPTMHRLRSGEVAGKVLVRP